MKDDSFKDKKPSSNTNQNDNSSSLQDDSLDWAKQAYLQLKQKQKEEKEIKEKEILKKKDLDNTIQINIKDEFKSNISLEQKIQVGQDSKVEDEPHLGDFDDTFTWSAEVLAAQGKKIDQFSLDDIDWLSRLKQGLEKTRKGFVTDLLDKLGDDPLTPEVLLEGAGYLTLRAGRRHRKQLERVPPSSAVC